ncbi:hypothetical protein H4R35_001336 [Dimargaris xerosporica]|nr:hypothetical protein H4R35_001336 [Dimargaris xerosporica]
MASYVQFTALSGAKNDDPRCYLLEIDSVRILLDCGTTDALHDTATNSLRQLAPKVDVVLLAHPTVEHLGAYVYAYMHLGLRCPVYATLPVQNMGSLTVKDMLLSRRDTEAFDQFTLADVDAAFKHINALRYHEPKPLAEKIVYAVDYNHMRDRHLGGSVILNQGVVLDALSRPSLLITDARNATVSVPPRKQRDVAFKEALVRTLEAGHSVLIPTDSAARVLELAYMVDQIWLRYRLTFPVFFLSHRSYRTIAYAKSMLEWMSDALTRKFASSREHPFDFKSITFAHRREEVDRVPGPKLVLASGESLDTGFARQLLPQWVADPQNMLLLCSRGSDQSLTRTLYQAWATAAPPPEPGHDPGAASLDMVQTMNIKAKVRLQGPELAEYLAQERQRKEQEASQAALSARNKALLDKDESDDSDIEIDDTDLEQLLFRDYDLFIKDPTWLGGRYHTDQTFRMFPYIERRKRFDDYGEVIDPAQYTQESLVVEDGVLVHGAARPTNSGERDGRLTGENGDGDEEPPFKYVTHQEQVHFQCQVQFLDFEGLADGRSVTNILNQWGAKKIVLVHGDVDSTAYLAQVCLTSDQITSDVYTPEIGEPIKVSSGSKTFEVTLTDALFSALKFARHGDYEFARLLGTIKLEAGQDHPAMDLVTHPGTQSWRPPVCIGDARLSHLQRLLQRQGFEAAFKEEGVLVVNDKVAVRKTEKGNLLVEGYLSPDYYRVRRLVYRLHAIC